MTTLDSNVGPEPSDACRKGSERLRAASAEILGILNDRLALRDAAARILGAIKRATGVDAAAIRLREGCDFPFAAAEGFSDHFIQLENSLLPPEADRRFCTEPDGSVSLECSCGFVLSGRAGELGAATPAGSLWTNQALPLPPEADPRRKPRDRCLHEGFRSAALVPIRLDGRNEGLLHVCDRRPDLFSPDTIEFFEAVAASFGVALARKRDQDALLASEATLRSLFDGIPESILMMDRAGTILAANQAFAARAGTTVEECLGRHVSGFAPEDVAARRLARMEEVFRTGGQVVFEDERAGRWAQNHLCPVVAADGSVRRVVEFSMDVTERRQMEEEIRLEHERLRMAVEAAHGATSEWDIPRNQVRWSPEMFALWGVEPLPETVEPEVWMSRVHPEDRDRMQGAVAEALETGTLDEEIRVVRADGSVRWLRCQAKVTRDNAGRPLRMVGITRDITDRRQMESDLREMNERYRHLLEASADWIWEVDAQGRYTFASQRVEQLFGYTPEEVLGKTPYDFMSEQEAARVRQLARTTAMAERRPIVGLQSTVQHKDGHPVTVETSAVPILGPNGEYRGYRGVDRDVSVRQRLEEQLRQSQKLEAVGQLAGGVAHDFNNILGAMMMHIGLLQADGALAPGLREGLAELEHDAERAATLTRQLLIFSRRSILETRTFDLSDLVANLLKMLRRLIGEHVELQFAAKAPAAGVEADPGMLEQVVLNLVVNARDALPLGGRVSISTDVLSIPPDAVPSHPGRRAGSFVCLTVADTGAGIDQEILGRIFEPFFTTKEAGKGTGLGLAVVHGIVAQHRGWIEVDSERGRGSSFRVFLPLAIATGERERNAVQGPVAQGKREGVLVVEDEAPLRRAVARLLDSLGYRVLSAANGQEAMALWQQQSGEIDLLLTDIVMPEGMTGLELSERLHGMRPGLRTIISSGYNPETVQSGGATREGVVYLPKPYTMRQLANLVRRCLDGSPS